MSRIEYPVCFYQTCKGTLSHLSAKNLEYFDLPVVNLSFGQIYGMKPAVDKFTKEFTTKNYFNFKRDTAVSLSSLELDQITIKGLSKKNAIKIKVQKNDTEITIDQFISFTKSINPDFIVSLTE